MDTLDLDLSKPVVCEFVSTATTPGHDEVYLFGPRGEGKTIAALGVMAAHAMKHKEAGFPLPVRWVGVTGTFTEHEEKTLPSLQEDFWGGVWRISDGGRQAALTLDGVVYVVLRLFGVPHASDLEKVRTGTHCVWVEEPAPILSEREKATGLIERVVTTALTSIRLPSYHNVVIITSNYPDIDHWTWQRARLRPAEGAACFEIPSGERTTQAYRDRMTKALIGDPALYARLVLGKPAPVLEGQPVARGFSVEAHVAPGPLVPIEGIPLVLGWDAGHTPTCVVTQPSKGHVYVYAGLYQINSGLRQLIVEDLKPWLAEHAPWSLRGVPGEASPFRHYTDHVMGTYDSIDRDANPHRLMREQLGGVTHLGQSAWTPRIEPLLALFRRATDAGRMALQIANTEHTRDLIRALMGRWSYPTTAAGGLRTDRPNKNDHPASDLGDSLCYAVGGIAPSKPAPDPRRQAAQRRALTAFDVLDYGHERPKVRTGFDW